VIKEIRLLNWKSYKDANLYIDPLNVLIGTNASGKSNAIDAIAFINNEVHASSLQASLDGESALLLDANIGGIRGGAGYAALLPGDQFTVETVIEEDSITDYRYSITVRTKPQVEVIAESLIKIIRNKKKPNKEPREKNIFYTNRSNDDYSSPSIHTNIINGQGKPIRKDLKNSVSVISQLKNSEIKVPEVSEAIQVVIKNLEEIFILDPIPSQMRDYKPFAQYLSKNAANLAGMIAALPTEKKEKLESQLTKYVSSLPEDEIERVWAEPVGRFQKDAMLYCEEKWGRTGINTTIDARGMSDGTLRFLGILTALLTRPSGSLIVIEEVDNGLHPSRAKLLLETMKEIGSERSIDILVTTHNPALMDELGIEMIPFIQIVHRDPEDGTSKITLLENIKSLPKLLAHGSVGELSTKGEIEKSLSHIGGVIDEK
jgi:predicted ATPase